MDQEQLNKMIEKELRFVIGDLHVQLIIMKQMLEMAKQPQGGISDGLATPTIPEPVKPNGHDTRRGA
jgi:hypothetical protein